MRKWLNLFSKESKDTISMFLPLIFAGLFIGVFLPFVLWWVCSPANAIEVTVGTATTTRAGRYDVAATVTEYEQNILEARTVVCTSTAGGAVTVTVSEISGTLERVVLAPGSGALAPSENFDVTLLDQDSIDLLGGHGADLTSITATQIAPHILSDPDSGDSDMAVFPMTTYGDLTFAGTNMGNAKEVTFRAYFRR